MKVKSREKQTNTTSKPSSRTFPWMERAFRELADNISDGVYCINTDGYFIYVNKALSDRSGIPQEQYPDLHFLDVIDPAYHGLARSNFQKVMGGEDGIPYELRLKDTRGQLRIVEVHSKPVRDGGKVIGILGISREITKRKLAEELLRNQEKYYQSLMENVSDIITVINSDNTIRYVSPSVKQVLGYMSDQVIGVSILHFVHPDDASSVRDDIKITVQDPSHIKKVEYRIRHNDGSWRIFEAIGKAFYDSEGKGCVIINARDITDKKLEEQVLKASEIGLSRLVKEKATEYLEKNMQLEREIQDLKHAESGLKKKIQELNAALKSHL